MPSYTRRWKVAFIYHWSHVHVPSIPRSGLSGLEPLKSGFECKRTFAKNSRIQKRFIRLKDTLLVVAEGCFQNGRLALKTVCSAGWESKDGSHDGVSTPRGLPFRPRRRMTVRSNNVLHHVIWAAILTVPFLWQIDARTHLGVRPVGNGTVCEWSH